MLDYFELCVCPDEGYEEIDVSGQIPKAVSVRLAFGRPPTQLPPVPECARIVYLESVEALYLSHRSSTITALCLIDYYCDFNLLGFTVLTTLVIQQHPWTINVEVLPDTLKHLYLTCPINGIKSFPCLEYLHLFLTPTSLLFPTTCLISCVTSLKVLCVNDPTARLFLSLLRVLPRSCRVLELWTPATDGQFLDIPPYPLKAVYLKYPSSMIALNRSRRFSNDCEILYSCNKYTPVSGSGWRHVDENEWPTRQLLSIWER
jgi:hypothetical protein